MDICPNCGESSGTGHIIGKCMKKVQFHIPDSVSEIESLRSRLAVAREALEKVRGELYKIPDAKSEIAVVTVVAKSVLLIDEALSKLKGSKINEIGITVSFPEPEIENSFKGDRP